MPDEQPTDTTPDLRAPHGALPEGGTVRAITRWGTPVMHRPQAPVTEYDDGAHLLVPARVRDTHHSRFQDCGVKVQRLFDFRAIDVFATGLYHFLETVAEEVVAALILYGEVAGVQPAATECLGGGIRPAVVASHQRGTLDADLAELAGCNRLAERILELGLGQ